MSRIKDYLFDMQEQAQDKNLAEKLGITYDELLQLDHSIDTEESNEGLVYNYIVSFSDDAPKKILDKVKGIDGNNMVWLPSWELESDDYYDEQYEAILSSKDYYDRFNNEISSAQKLNEVEFEDKELEAVLKRQIYISVIGALETFLSETFINQIDENEEYFKNFVEAFPDFKKQKFELSQVFIQHEQIKDTTKKVLLDIIYHHLDKVSNMYSSTFQIDFPDIKDLSKCVSIRHHLVHRSGKTKDGEKVTVDKAANADLIEKAYAFVKDIATKLNLVEGQIEF